MEDTNDMIVYRLGANCDLDEVEEGKTYLGRVQGFAPFGVFVQLNDRVKGLVHKSNVKLQHTERDPIIVHVLQIRSNGNIDLEEVTPTVYQTQNVNKKTTNVLLSDIGKKIGRTVLIEGEIAQIKQTSGPTIFTVVDESGTANAAAFIEAGVRAYPEVNLGDIVSLTGEVMQRNNQLQIEARSMAVMDPGDAGEVRGRIDAALEKRAEPPDLPFLIESEVLDALRPRMRQVAKEIRKAVLTARPIILRHHADADGICAAVAIEQAVTALLRESAGDFDAEYFLFKRSPSKAPFYEVEDITRDLDFALKDNVRYGQKMPLILLMDNGSTEEDMPSLKLTRIYGLPVMVVDHHHPDKVVDDYLIGHVNPYLAGGDYGITAGMLGTEIARMVNPAIEDQIRHLPAIAGVGDRSEAPERARYLAVAAPGYSEDDCRDIALALDYEQFWLRFGDGRELVKDILNLSGKPERHEQFVDLLVEEANHAIEEQLSAIMPHVESRVLQNGAHLFMLDVEIFAHRFTFPPPGKTSGEVHDRS
ncbi:MAG: OB-fold nucleic acid binding domain-containing protein, partial [Methanoculleus sp.]|nr:OB-fold nucleic acid binding domain-containing protein [Methanoculleus sp.]